MNRKKLINTITRIFCGLFAVIILSYVGIGAFGGFDLKGMPCKGGFLTALYQLETEKIKEISGETLDESELAQIKFNLSINKDNDKEITTKFINENGEEIKLQCTMNWYWNDDYRWSKIV